MESILLLAVWLISGALSCEQILLDSEYTFLDDIFTLTGDFVNGRPLYSSNNKDETKTQFLYHVYHENHGRWIIGDSTDKATGWAFVTTWAVYPTDTMVQSVSPGTQWRVSNNAGGWEDPGKTLTLTCRDNQDRTIFATSKKVPHLHGIWVINRFDTHVWRRIDSDMFMFREEEGDRSWLIGTKFTGNESLFIVASNSDTADWPQDITTPWEVDVEGKKESEAIPIFNGATNDQTPNIMQKIRSYFRLKPNAFQREAGRKPDDDYYSMNNGMLLPKVGFGTGGLSGREAIKGLLDDATSAGYQLIDSAEAYESEHPLGSLFSEGKISRSDVFVTSKVWPTNLGFRPTVLSIDESLKRLKTPYIDLYLIHWPQCYEHFEWMDCKNASPGNWEESWSAMEKFYSEAVFLSIGVSNFNLPLLDTLQRQFSVKPQVIQNLWTLTHREHAILDYCKDEGIIFQAYATFRHIAMGEDDDWKRVLEPMGRKLAKSPSQIVNRWIVQQGMAVMPRSKQPPHMLENLEVLKFKLPQTEFELLKNSEEPPKDEI